MTKPPRAVQFALAERLAHLDRGAWDGLTREAGVFMQRPFLTALEAAAPENVSPRYALMYRGDEAIAALQLQLVRVEGRSARVVASMPSASMRMPASRVWGLGPG